MKTSFEFNIERAVELSDETVKLQKSEIGSINYALEKLRLKERGYELDNKLTDAHKLEQSIDALSALDSKLVQKVDRGRS